MIWNWIVNYWPILVLILLLTAAFFLIRNWTYKGNKSERAKKEKFSALGLLILFGVVIIGLIIWIFILNSKLGKSIHWNKLEKGKVYILTATTIEKDNVISIVTDGNDNFYLVENLGELLPFGYGDKFIACNGKIAIIRDDSMSTSPTEETPSCP